MNAGLDGGVLGGQTVSVKANREQYVVALKPSLAADYLKAGISLDMTYVHTCAGGVGELYESVEFRLGSRFLRGTSCVRPSISATYFLWQKSHIFSLPFCELSFHTPDMAV